MSKEFKNVYQFKITLQGIKPAIWRRIQVPETYTLWDLHLAIQDAMGWENCHLHEFIVIDPASSKTRSVSIPDHEWDADPIYSDNKIPIKPIFSKDIKKAKYIYDFGDGWEHSVVLEKILPKSADTHYPVCLAGKRACPPEDCGGIWGYEELVTILKNPKNKGYKERMEWLGCKYDPEDFSPKEVTFTEPNLSLNELL